MDNDLRQRDRDLAKRITGLDAIFKRLYEDNISGKLSDERFQKLSADYEKEERNLKVLTSSLRKEVELEESKSADVDRFLSVVERYTDIPELTPCILHEFVEKIIVHAAATRRARTGRRRSTFTTRVSGSWKCQKSRHQWKNEKTVQPKLYRSLFPHDVFLSGAALPLFSFYSMLSLCSDRCKSKSRPRVQTLRMYTSLWISSTEYKITSFRVTYCRIPAELHGSTSYSGYLAGNTVKFSCIKARRRLYHRSAKAVSRYCCIIYISFSVISRSAVEV